MDADTSLLQRELRQSKPFPSPAQEAVVALLRTADVVRRRVAAIVEREGITLQQYNVLRIMRGAGAAGIPTLSIAERMIEHAPGITRLMDRLEQAGLGCRRRCTEDRRQVFCEITPAGLELLARLDEPIAAAEETLMGGLDGPSLRRLLALLEAVRREG